MYYSDIVKHHGLSFLHDCCFCSGVSTPTQFIYMTFSVMVLEDCGLDLVKPLCLFRHNLTLCFIFYLSVLRCDYIHLFTYLFIYPRFFVRRYVFLRFTKYIYTVGFPLFRIEEWQSQVRCVSLKEGFSYHTFSLYFLIEHYLFGLFVFNGVVSLVPVVFVII